MKFCLSAKQTKEYLSKADEIMFMYSDRKGIKSYFDEYPEATIILRHDRNSENIDWKEIKALNSVKKKGFVLCLDNIQDCLKAKEEGLDFYHVRPVTNYYDFQALYDLGVKYVYIAAPLFFDLAYLPMDRPEVRVYANEANVDGLPRANGVCGPWIRPEDLDLYDDHVDVVEFFPSVDKDLDSWLKKERALYRIYAEEHEWPGNLSQIINNLGDKDAANRMIIPEFTETRMFCGQKCNKTGTCHMCDLAFRMADPERAKKYFEEFPLPGQSEK